MKILVTGGIGFLGANLCNQLVRDGHDVVSMDVRATSDAEQRLLDPRVYRHVGDVRNSVDFPNGDYDQVYHLACPASPPRYQADPLFTLETCFLGTRNALQFAKARGARLLFTSTSEIYGDPQVTPQDESYRGWVNTVGIRSNYDEGKRVAETLCYEFAKTQDVRVVRIFNTYGPGMDADDGRVVSNFIMQSLTKQPHTIYGDGSQTRSLCYVDDMIDGLVLAMNARELPQPVNLGNPNEMPVFHISTAVEYKLGFVDRVFKPLPEDDPLQRRPDISRAKTRLGWQPKVNLSDGLIKTIEWFKGGLK